jgi:D-alanine-D-alanine ligase
MSSFEIAVLGNLRRNAPHREGEPADAWGDLDSESTLMALVEALEKGGHRSYFLEGDMSLPANLARLRPDICFNFSEGLFGDSREAHIPAVLEMMGIPYTGSRVLTQALCLDKAMTKRVLSTHGIPTAPFQVFRSPRERRNPRLRFPLFVKPNREGSGMGISPKSIVRDEVELRTQVAYITETYQQEALVERYIEGRELTCGLVGNENSHVFPVMEIDLSTSPADQLGLYTNHIKHDIPETPTYRCPAPLDEAMTMMIKRLTVQVFHAVGALDVSRVDLRIDQHDGKPYVLEINTLPGLTPGISDLVIVAAADGIDHTQLVNMVFDAAAKRLNLQPRARRAKRTSRAQAIQVPAYTQWPAL